MRTISMLRALVLAAVLTVPLVQSAFAQQDQQEQQSMASQNAATASSYGGGPYDNDALMSPPVGD